MIVVSGLHRSGTTYVGQILKTAGVSVIHEPLNERFGMNGVSIAYPYVEHTNESRAQLIHDAINLSRPWNRRTNFVQADGFRKIAFRATGGRNGLRWSALRIRKSLGLPLGKVCLKDPFMSLATPLIAEHHSLKVLCMVRHPAAIHNSTQNRNWSFDIKNLLRQPDLVERYGSDITGYQWKLAEKHAAASIAILWKLMWRINHSLGERNSQLKIVTHETLCIEPIKTAYDICEHFDIGFTYAQKNFVNAHSKGERVEAIDGRVHDFKRDSKAIPTAWRRNVILKDLKIIEEIAGNEIIQVYGSL